MDVNGSVSFPQKDSLLVSSFFISLQRGKQSLCHVTKHVGISFPGLSPPELPYPVHSVTLTPSSPLLYRPWV